MSDGKPVIIERVLNAPVEKVWAAWTEPEQIKKWWGPKGFTAPSISLDFRVGGKYLYAMHGPAGTQYDMDMWSVGTYREIVPQKKIVATDNFADEHGNVVPASTFGLAGDWPESLLVTTEFEDLGGKTKLTITHEGAPAGEQTSNMTQGWNESLDKLAVSLQ